MKHIVFKKSYNALKERVEECTGKQRASWEQLTDEQKQAVEVYLLAQDAAIEGIIPTVGPDGKPPKQP